VGLALALAAGPPALARAGAPAAPAPVSVVGDCLHASQRPAAITIACADGNFFLSKLRWSGWSGPVARAAGLANANDCTPNCAAGRFHHWKVRVALSAPTVCRGFSRRLPRRRYYDTVTVVAVGAHPRGTPAREVVRHLTCG